MRSIDAARERLPPAVCRMNQNLSERSSCAGEVALVPVPVALDGTYASSGMKSSSNTSESVIVVFVLLG